MIQKTFGVALAVVLMGSMTAHAQSDRGAILTLCDVFPEFRSELSAFYLAFSPGSALFDDLDGDGLPEIASLAVIDFAACDRNQEQLVGLENLGSETMIAYNNNQATLAAEAQFAALAPYQNALAALMVVGEEMQTFITMLLADNGITLTGTYEFIFLSALRAADNPYAGDGDLDNDFELNSEEWDEAVAQNMGVADSDAIGFFFIRLLDGLGADAGGGGGSGGCIITNVSLGTPLAEELGTIRSFRDSFLTSNPLGTALAGLYYRVSPSVAEGISSNSVATNTVRGVLAPVVWMVHGIMAFPAIMLVPFALGAGLFGRRRIRSRN
jgi:hypothetical protein